MDDIGADTPLSRACAAEPEIVSRPDPRSRVGQQWHQQKLVRSVTRLASDMAIIVVRKESKPAGSGMLLSIWVATCCRAFFSRAPAHISRGTVVRSSAHSEGDDECQAAKSDD